MTKEQEVVLEIKKTIEDLPPELRGGACNELAEHFRQCCNQAGPVSGLAIALVGAEMAAKE